MSNKNIICPKCNINLIKKSDAKSCWDCHKEFRKANKPINYKGALVCECGNKKAWHAKKCRNCGVIGLANCKVCYGKLSVYKNSNQYNTGICQKCYKGELSKRWNSELTITERELYRTKQPEYHEWRGQVFLRDNFSCQSCGDNKGGNLNAHHIENYSNNKEKRFDINNGITLCGDCHTSFHKEYGWKQNDVIQLMDFITNANWIIIANN